MKPATRGSASVDEIGVRLRSGRITTPTNMSERRSHGEEEDSEHEEEETVETSSKTTKGTETNTWSAGTGYSAAGGTDSGTNRSTGGGDTTLTEETNERDITVISKDNVDHLEARTEDYSELRVKEQRRMLIESRMREAAMARQLAEVEYEMLTLKAPGAVSKQSNVDFTHTQYGACAVGARRKGERGVDKSSEFAHAQYDATEAAHRRERGAEGGYGNYREARDGTRENARSSVDELTSALSKALRMMKNESVQSSTPPPPKYLHDLPAFDGDISEWIAFKTVYEDTRCLFNEPQNIARLRKALKGAARESVKALLYSGNHTLEVMEALERRFGRPELLIINELEVIKKMPRLQEDGKNLASFASKIANCVASIKALKRPQYLYSPEITHRIASKLNNHLRYRWFEYTTQYPDEPDLEKMSCFLNEMSEQCGAYMAFDMRQDQRRDAHFDKKRRPVHTTRMYESEEETASSEYDSDYSDQEEPKRLVATVEKSSKRFKREEKRVPTPSSPKQGRKNTCPLCSETHGLRECEKFRALSYDERWDKVKELRVCFRCLGVAHRRVTCRAKACGKDGCRVGHHRLLHREKEEVRATVASSVNALVGEHNTYLKILPVELYGPRGKIETYALLDEGSTMTLIEEETALKVVPRGKAEPLSIEGIGGKRTDFNQSFRLSVKIKGRFERKMEPMTAYTIGPLNLTTQAVSRELVAKCAHLKEIEDQLIYEGARPTILIGQDNWHLITSRDIKEGDIDQPVASYTSLGWVLHGREKAHRRGRAMINYIAKERKSDPIDTMIKEHFSLESLGIEAKKPSNDIDKRALSVLESTTKQLPSGRYETGLIWRTDNEKMPENRENAERRLYSIERKLEKDGDMKKEYSKQIENLLKKEFAEEAPHTPMSPRTWYLPHFAVRHPQKGKIRLVFDAAARVGGRSLNDALLPGPDLLQSLFGVLARFREGRVAVIADIKEMFLQVKIREEDRDSLRFLWRANRDEPVKEYRMTSLIFGAASSPCTAIYVKNKNAERYRSLYPATAAAVERHFYMDDYLQAFEDAATANRAVKEMREIHEGAKFELRGWASNDPTALRDIEESSTSPSTATLGDKEERTLGLIWKINADTLSFALNLRNTPRETIDGHRPPTKREVTSAVMSVFDPLGLASPITVQGKKLIQNIWRSGIDWDTEVTKELESEWKKWLRDLSKLEGLEVPRSITPSPHKGEMHVFVDASEQAYACAAYWKDEETKRVSLIAAKAKVTPLKPISIPRLELQAAVLGCRLANSLKSELNSETTSTTFWTDSRTVLSWIKADPRQFKPFVAHRLAEMEETSTPLQWRWIPTKLNVADDATRESPAEFSTDHRWFTGPPFLQLSPNEWPQEKPKEIAIDNTELKRANVNSVNSMKSKHEPLPAVARFSKWGKYVRATARVLQCVEILRRRYRHEDTEKKGKIYPLTANYLRAAELLILQHAQRADFAEEIVKIKKQQHLPKSSPLSKLCVELDQHDVLRVTGRLDHYNNLDETKKRPAILNARNAVTQLLIQHTHEKFYHGNHETVINELRQQYFILALRNAVRKLLYECQWCKLRKLRPTKPQEGPLPAERMNHNAPPFNCAAIDYFGPITVTIGRRREKRWGALITCLTTRAIHIELAASLTPSSAIMALRRFMARRGTPSVMYSDNGTNFVRANKELAEAAAEVTNYATARGIVWKFIPPGAPHMGGAWERMIRTVKTSLSTILKERAPREEILHTLLLEVEHVVNSRPLTPVQPDLHKEALTPNHFLIGRSCGVTPIGLFNARDADGHTWKAAQHLADQFWARWTKEYLPLLLPRKPLNSQHHREPKIGDIVLISDGTMPRGLWPRGEVINTIPGSDSKIRVVEVRTNTGILRRPTSRLVILT